LFDALVIIINLILAMEFQANLFVDGSETCDQFYVEQKHVVGNGEGDQTLFTVFENI
jgi:hypothetical protein